MHNPFKIVVFDMDETLGYFVEFGIFWEALNNYIKYAIETKIVEEPIELTQEDFNQILDLYPEFIRPNIYSILNYLKHKMNDRTFKGVMIYTNNQGPKIWTSLIKNYFESKIHFNLFVHIISAFKINGRQVELCRTTNDKNLHDFIRCSKLPANTQICFLDDTYYPNMNNDNVYYIKVKPYTYDLSFESLIHRFSESEISTHILKTNEEKKAFLHFMTSYMNQFQFLYVNKTKEEYEIDKIVTKKIMIHLQTFFNKRKIENSLKNSTVGKIKKSKNKTIKRLNVS
jgi:hypothetical protein